MPRIQLKPKSPEFAEAKKSARTRACEMPGCTSQGDHRAPKDRSLSDHYWFCVDHITDYNKAWDFFSGMAASEVENHINNSLYGDRPTWRYDVDGAAAEALRRATWQTYNFTEEEPPQDFRKKKPQTGNPNTPEFEALALMGLEPPVTLLEIKARYKQLAKKHHPDYNPGDKTAEDTLKSINMAYTILKLSYAKFEKIENK